MIIPTAIERLRLTRIDREHASACLITANFACRADVFRQLQLLRRTMAGATRDRSRCPRRCRRRATGLNLGDPGEVLREGLACCRHRHRDRLLSPPNPLIVVGSPCPRDLRARPAAERHEVIANRANLRFRVAVQVRIERLRIVGPERRHARAGQNVRRLLQPLQNPVRARAARASSGDPAPGSTSADPSESRRARGTAGT